MEHAGECTAVFFVKDRDRILVKQQLQVTNLAANLGMSHAGNPAIANIAWYYLQSLTEVT